MKATLISLLLFTTPALAQREYLKTAEAEHIAAAIVAKGDEVDDDFDTQIELSAMFVGEPMVVPLMKILQQPDHIVRVRQRAFSCIGLLGQKGESAAKALSRMVVSEEEMKGTYAISALTGLHTRENDAARAANKLLADGDFPYTSEVYRLVESLGPAAAPVVPELQKALRAKLRHCDPFLLQAIGELGPAVAPLMPELEASLKEHQFQGEILPVIAALGPDAKPLAPMLVKRITSTKTQQRDLVACLGDMGPAAAEYLETIRKVTNTKLYLSDAVALLRIEGDNAALVDILREKLDEGRWTTAALDEIARVGADAAPLVPDVLKYHEAFLTKQGKANSRVAETLSAIGQEAKAAVPALLKAGQSEKSDSTRSKFIRAVGEVAEAGDGEVIAALEAIAINDESKSTARAALKARLLLLD